MRARLASRPPRSSQSAPRRVCLVRVRSAGPGGDLIKRRLARILGPLIQMGVTLGFVRLLTLDHRHHGYAPLPVALVVAV